jgi:hypothetical protein
VAPNAVLEQRLKKLKLNSEGVPVSVVGLRSTSGDLRRTLVWHPDKGVSVDRRSQSGIRRVGNHSVRGETPHTEFDLRRTVVVQARVENSSGRLTEVSEYRVELSSSGINPAVAGDSQIRYSGRGEWQRSQDTTLYPAEGVSRALRHVPNKEYLSQTCGIEKRCGVLRRTPAFAER